MATITRREAIKLSIKKWEWIEIHCNDYSFKHINSDGYGYLIQCIPELEDLNSHCGLCELYLNPGSQKKYCTGCPFKKGELTCFDNGHIYQSWNRRDKYDAHIIANQIKTILKKKLDEEI